MRYVMALMMTVMEVDEDFREFLTSAGWGRAREVPTRCGWAVRHPIAWLLA